eukprot:CAMPEP_0119033604 /NCGR_PEP_ID=MMETSP1177-20130426/657_1 /TAXON_ID=2985 /ORGANISM="Ochromonas sp, Strain CCMP1899" /LENGTH=293 /DNA_ID=CAMNT_0006990475 /DNA_START=152 /DNA_END=1030 /DNA_ORIENTATION=+
MEWLFDRRGKSVAQSAQRVVADMHRHLEKQNKKVSELESVITQFNKLFTDSLENDLSRLELRRKELAAEMLTVDTAIAERRNRLQNVREEIYQILAKNEADLNNNSRSLSLNGTSLDHSQNGNEKGMTIAETRASALEEQYLEESEMLATIKDLGHDILFVVHRNNVNDVIVYSPAQTETDIMTSFKLTDFNDKNSIYELTTFENMMAYGAKIVPNHDRDFPHIKELAIPPVVSEEHRGVLAQLWGAVEIPLTPDVIMDVWKGPDQICWVTTSVNGVSFAVLERMFVTSELKW